MNTETTTEQERPMSAQEWRDSLHCPECKHAKHEGRCKGLRFMPCGCKAEVSK